MSISEAKHSLRLAQSDSTHDDLLLDAIDAATEQVEQDTDRAIILQEFVYSRAGFPKGGGSIVLSLKPVQAVEKIEYLDPDGALTVLDAADYYLDQGRRQIHLEAGAQWPTTQRTPNSVLVEFNAGYGTTSASVPRLIKQAVLLQVGKWFTDPVMESNDLIKLDKAYWSIVDKISSTGFPSGESA